MAGSKDNAANNSSGISEKVAKSPKDSGDDSDEESDILEESPCGRWQKRNDEVKQRDVPGIDIAYLAMDVEEGVEVVWNEVQFSERKDFKTQEEKIRRVFDNLIQLDHPNIVKFHKYWMDTKGDKPRVVFITEYMSSGSLKQFLKRTKRNVKKLPLQAWTRWCTQILSALSYLHLCTPPIIHGNLTCDTIFIQHTGLVKIGSVAPDAINHHVKTYREHMKHMHFVAPEFGNSVVTHKADIYSFGMCALETAALEIPGNGDTGTVITQETITKTLETLENPLQKEFISQCLRIEPEQRPSARELLLHPILFEVHTLKLLSAHALGPTKTMTETVDEMIERYYGSDKVVADITHPDGSPGVQYSMKDVPVIEKLEKFVEEVRYGIYPLTAYGHIKPTITRPASPELDNVVKADSPEPNDDQETRQIINSMCNVKPKTDGNGLSMTILLRLDDKMNRQLSCDVTDKDNPVELSAELVKYGFINKSDEDKVTTLIEDSLRNFSQGVCGPAIAVKNVPLPELVNGDTVS